MIYLLVNGYSGGGCSDADRTDDNRVQVLYHSGRHKTSKMGDEYRQYTSNNPLFGLDLGKDQTEGSYSPDELNLWIQFSLKAPLSNGAMLSIPEVTLAQGSETSSIKAIFNVFKDAADTVFYAFDDEFEESLDSFTDLVGDSLKLAFENNWYASQPGENVYMTTYKGQAGLVIQGKDDMGNSYPVIIQQGEDDHHFLAYIPVAEQTESLAASSFVGTNHFFHPSIGIYSRDTDSDWIHSVHLGWLLPVEALDVNPKPWTWLYQNNSNSWILMSSQYPGFTYRELSNEIFEYDPAILEFKRRPDLDLPRDAPVPPAQS